MEDISRIDCAKVNLQATQAQAELVRKMGGAEMAIALMVKALISKAN